MPQENLDVIRAFREGRLMGQLQFRCSENTRTTMLLTTKITHGEMMVKHFPYPRGGSKFADQREIHVRNMRRLKKARRRLELVKMMIQMQGWV